MGEWKMKTIKAENENQCAIVVVVNVWGSSDAYKSVSSPSFSSEQSSTTQLSILPF
jgi:hypothetical protein